MLSTIQKAIWPSCVKILHLNSSLCIRIIFYNFFSSSKSVVSYSGSDVFIFSNQIRTFYEGSKLSQMKQDIAKSRVKYGGTRFKGILPSDKTKIRKYFILSQNLMGQYYETYVLRNKLNPIIIASSRKWHKGQTV